MYDAPDNQVVYLPPTLHSLFHANKPHIVLSRDSSCTLQNFGLFFTDDICVRSTNRYIESVFNARRTCCCWWHCLEVKKRQKTVRTRGFVRFIYTAHRRETVEKQRFRPCPEKNTQPFNGEPRRTAPYDVSQHRTATVWVMVAENRTEPHRRIPGFWKPHQTAPQDFIFFKNAPTAP